MLTKLRIPFLTAIPVIILAMLAGCGSSSSKNEMMDKSMANGDVKTVEMVQGEYSGAGDSENQKLSVATADGASKTPQETVAREAEDAKAISGGTAITQNVTNAILAERKVIRSANVSVEVKDFDEAYGKISNFILGIGYIQSTNIESEKYVFDGKERLIRRGMIIVRVDKELFDKVLSSIKGIGDIMNWNINGEDVTDKYFDVESRLRLLRIEEIKLEEYLKKLDDLDKIFRTESKLTEIRYEIEALTGNLKKMADLVALSTITINIAEEYPEAKVGPQKPKTYGQKLLDSFLDSFKGVTGFVGDLIMFLVAAIPVLVLLGAFLLLGIFIYRKIPRKQTIYRQSPLQQNKYASNHVMNPESGEGQESAANPPVPPAPSTPPVDRG